MLVVGDDPALPTAVAQFLPAPTYVCEASVSGKGALDRLRAHPFALCVVEVDMAWMDGLALVRALAARGQAIPTILVGSLQAALTAPAIGAVAMPLWASEFRPLVAAALRASAPTLARVRVRLTDRAVPATGGAVAATSAVRGADGLTTAVDTTPSGDRVMTGGGVGGAAGGDSLPPPFAAGRSRP